MPDLNPILTPAVFYQDPRAAIAWLENAFGFETAMLVTDESGAIGHAEVAYRNAVIAIGAEWRDDPKLAGANMLSPRTTGGALTQFIWLSVEKDIDAHCERAREAGAIIAQEPEDQFYGARTYRALDPEGHVWCFTQAVRVASQEEMEKSGFKVSYPLEEKRS